MPGVSGVVNLRIGAFTLLLFTTLSPSSTSDPWDRAVHEIRRLPPAAFSAILSRSMLKELESQGCTIPQSYSSRRPHNVIQGRFAHSAQVDRAVLCSRAEASRIVVFWGGRARCASEIAAAPDKDALQVVEPGRILYSRRIAVATREYIVSRNSPRGESGLPHIDHEGINDLFIGKASVVHYCERGKWMRLRGAD